MGADWRKTIVLFAQLGVSATILSVCSYVMISKQYPDDYVKWASALIGVVVGYWLK
ncbi:MAG: hypothetical protein WCA22_00355 [Candidatus Binatus sp.]